MFNKLNEVHELNKVIDFLSPPPVRKEHRLWYFIHNSRVHPALLKISFGFFFSNENAVFRFANAPKQNYIMSDPYEGIWLTPRAGVGQRVHSFYHVTGWVSSQRVTAPASAKREIPSAAESAIAGRLVMIESPKCWALWYFWDVRASSVLSMSCSRACKIKDFSCFCMYRLLVSGRNSSEFDRVGK